MEILNDILEINSYANEIYDPFSINRFYDAECAKVCKLYLI